MAGREPALTTHVLNTAEGIPGVGIPVQLWRLEPAPVLITETVTNADGRTDAPLMRGEGFVEGVYELRFAIGAYFSARGAGPAEPFLDVVPLRVSLKPGGGHYHVPLLCSPWSYSTYRGS
ncbi:hydroxyisourate hydrolase [Acetobacteraceae bacterium H6797]|nr:hydroxyisourate hydrolase [Acetobacteraceae bacterium H6797]